MLETALVKRNCSLRVKITVKTLVSAGIVVLAVLLPQLVHLAAGQAGGGERRLPCPCAARHLNPLSIVVANRLLSRSVIRKIERPFDELLAGAR